MTIGGPCTRRIPSERMAVAIRKRDEGKAIDSGVSARYSVVAAVGRCAGGSTPDRCDVGRCPSTPITSRVAIASQRAHAGISARVLFHFIPSLPTRRQGRRNHDQQAEYQYRHWFAPTRRIYYIVKK